MLIPHSSEFQGLRCRAVFDRVYPRPLDETAHEFLVFILCERLGADWLAEQRKLPNSARPTLVRWLDEFDVGRAGGGIDPMEHADHRSVTASGNLQALLCLAEDVADLAHRNALDAALMERLRPPDQFQGVRYEIAMAAVVLRTGFAITWITPTNASQTPEFTAVGHGVEFDVEVRSHHRAGVLGTPGEMKDPEHTTARVGGLLNAASNKASGDRPFVACIDLNLPANSRRTDVQTWMDQVKRSYDQIPNPAPESPDAVSGYLLTNFAYHYQGEEEMIDLGQSFLVVSMYRKRPLPDEVLHALRETCAAYGALPPREW